MFMKKTFERIRTQSDPASRFAFEAGFFLLQLRVFRKLHPMEASPFTFSSS